MRAPEISILTVRVPWQFFSTSPWSETSVHALFGAGKLFVNPPDMRDDLLHCDVTEQIIRGFYEVHYELRRVFLL